MSVRCSLCSERMGRGEAEAHWSADLAYAPFSCRLCGFAFQTAHDARRHFSRPELTLHPHQTRPQILEKRDPAIEDKLRSLRSQLEQGLESAVEKLPHTDDATLIDAEEIRSSEYLDPMEAEEAPRRKKEEGKLKMGDDVESLPIVLPSHQTLLSVSDEPYMDATSTFPGRFLSDASADIPDEPIESNLADQTVEDIAVAASLQTSSDKVILDPSKESLPEEDESSCSSIDSSIEDLSSSSKEESKEEWTVQPRAPSVGAEVDEVAGGSEETASAPQALLAQCLICGVKLRGETEHMCVHALRHGPPRVLLLCRHCGRRSTCWRAGNAAAHQRQAHGRRLAQGDYVDLRGHPEVARSLSHWIVQCFGPAYAFDGFGLAEARGLRQLGLVADALARRKAWEESGKPELVAPPKPHRRVKATCRLCQTAMRQNDASPLASHVLSVHMESGRGIVCTRCDASFKSLRRCSVGEHMKTKHGLSAQVSVIKANSRCGLSKSETVMLRLLVREAFGITVQIDGIDVRRIRGPGKLEDLSLPVPVDAALKDEAKFVPVNIRVYSPTKERKAKAKNRKLARRLECAECGADTSRSFAKEHVVMRHLKRSLWRCRHCPYERRGLWVEVVRWSDSLLMRDHQRRRHGHSLASKGVKSEYHDLRDEDAAVELNSLLRKCFPSVSFQLRSSVVKMQNARNASVAAAAQGSGRTGDLPRPKTQQAPERYEKTATKSCCLCSVKVSKSEEKNHVMLVHIGEAALRCKHCPYQSPNWSGDFKQLQSHMDARHPGTGHWKAEVIDLRPELLATLNALLPKCFGVDAKLVTLSKLLGFNH